MKTRPATEMALTPEESSVLASVPPPPTTTTTTTISPDVREERLTSNSSRTSLVDTLPFQSAKPASWKRYAGQNQLTVAPFRRGRCRLNADSSLPQAYELSVLTGTQVLLLVVSETGLVYTFTTPKLQPLVTKPEGKNLIQVCCLHSPSGCSIVLTLRFVGVPQCARACSREWKRCWRWINRRLSWRRQSHADPCSTGKHAPRWRHGSKLRNDTGTTTPNRLPAVYAKSATRRRRTLSHASTGYDAAELFILVSECWDAFCQSDRWLRWTVIWRERSIDTRPVLIQKTCLKSRRKYTMGEEVFRRKYVQVSGCFVTHACMLRPSTWARQLHFTH